MRDRVRLFSYAVLVVVSFTTLGKTPRLVVLGPKDLPATSALIVPS